MQQLDAEAGIVVHVDDRPRPEPKRRPVAAHPGLHAAAVDGLELPPLAKSEGDVEQPLIRDPIARRPRRGRRVLVLDQLDGDVAGPKRERIPLRPIEAPQRLVLRPMEAEAFRLLQPQDLDKGAPRSLEVGNREGHRSHRRGDLGPRALPSLWRSGVLLHQLTQDAVRVTQTDAAVAWLADGLAQGWRPGRHSAGNCRVELGHPEGDRRLADVAGPPVGASLRTGGLRNSNSSIWKRSWRSTSHQQVEAERGTPGPGVARGPSNMFVPPAGSSPSTSRYQRWVRRRSVTLDGDLRQQQGGGIVGEAGASGDVTRRAGARGRP